MRDWRILQINSADRGGGAEGSACDLLEGYRRAGLRSWLAVGRKHGDDLDVLEIDNEGSRPGWARGWRRAQAWAQRRNRSRLGRVCAGMAVLGEPARALELVRGAQRLTYPGTWRLLDLVPERPDIIHCHNLHGAFFDLRALPWLSRQAPLVLNLRDLWLLAGHCAYPLGCERWRAGCGRCPDLSIYPAVTRDSTAFNWQRKRSIYSRSRLYVTTPSHWLMDLVGDSMLKPALTRVVPNSVDLQVFRSGDRAAARRILGLPRTAQIVLAIVHSPFKDLATLEGAFEALSRRTSEELLFVCLGRAGAPRAAGNGTIRWSGWEADRRRVAAYYQAADVYVHAAHDETFGKTIAEAAACRTPTVAAAVGGIPEVVEDGQTGILVAPSDPGAMSAAILRLLDDEGLRIGMGERAAIRAGERFSIDRQVAAFIDWYGEIQDDWRAWRRDTSSSGRSERSR